MTNSFWVEKFWENPEGVTAIGTCALAVITFFTLLSIVLLRRQMIGDHERSRREMAISLMQCYCTTQDPTDHEVTFAMGLLQGLSHDNCNALWHREVFQIESKNQHILDAWRNAYKVKGVSGGGGSPLNITPIEVYMLRKVATNMLNKLEMIAAAWHNNIADKTIIEQEFVKVFWPRDGASVLEQFRKASGVYPSIGRFCVHYEKQKDSSFVQKPPIQA